eukprot:1187746-Prorocentrum_minimum.AAC.1
MGRTFSCSSSAAFFSAATFSCSLCRDVFFWGGVFSCRCRFPFSVFPFSAVSKRKEGVRRGSGSSSGSSGSSSSSSSSSGSSSSSSGSSSSSSSSSSVRSRWAGEYLGTLSGADQCKVVRVCRPQQQSMSVQEPRWRYCVFPRASMYGLLLAHLACGHVLSIQIMYTGCQRHWLMEYLYGLQLFRVFLYPRLVRHQRRPGPHPCCHSVYTN